MSNNEERWYNIEIPYNTREMMRRAENLKECLDTLGYKAETSAAGDHVHFEILASASNAELLNKIIDRVVFYDAISNVEVL